MGMRGLLSDQNYAYLLMVNGKNINMNYQYGPFSEFQNKDLNDIKEIQVIRGPGSVTYGTGAIAGVINIYTFPESIDSASLGNNADFQYNYNTVRSSIVHEESGFTTGLYASQTGANGLDGTKFWYIDRAHGYGYGYMSPDWGNMGRGTLAPRYTSSYLDKKENKLQANFTLGKNFNVWSRYTSFSSPQLTQSGKTAEGDAWSGFTMENYILEINQKYPASQKVNLQTKLGFRSTNLLEIGNWQQDALSIDHIAQRRNSFAENELSFRTQADITLSDKYSFALGTEIAYSYYTPQWGDDDDMFIMSFQPDIRFAVKTTDSGFYKFYYNPTASSQLVTVIDDRIDGIQYSLFGESNLNFNRMFHVLLSARMDKHEYTDPAYSTRLSLISQFSDTASIALSAQQSTRVPCFMNLYSAHYNSDKSTDYEKLQGMELIVRNRLLDNLDVNMAGYFNSIDQISWDPDTEAPGMLGILQLLGIETDWKYNIRSNSFGLSYAYINQIDWKGEFNADAWIKGLDGEEIHVKNNAENRINNLPGHSLKAYSTFTVFPHVAVHLNGRFAFDYQQNEMLDMFEEAHAEYGNSETIQEMHNIRKALEDHGYGKPSFTSNLSIAWQFPIECIELRTKIYAMNFCSYNNVRYIIQYWETGNLRQYPRQAGFLDQPVTIGVDFSINL
jgi:outer membrane receptor protein involved in Fe transport